MDISQDDDDFCKWIVIVKEALSCLDKKTYTWNHLPCKGGFYDQDVFLMAIWNVIADEFYLAMKDPEMMKFFEVKNAESTA